MLKTDKQGLGFSNDVSASWLRKKSRLSKQRTKGNHTYACMSSCQVSHGWDTPPAAGQIRRWDKHGRSNWGRSVTEWMGDLAKVSSEEREIREFKTEEKTQCGATAWSPWAFQWQTQTTWVWNTEYFECHYVCCVIQHSSFLKTFLKSLTYKLWLSGFSNTRTHAHTHAADGAAYTDRQ